MLTPDALRELRALIASQLAIFSAHAADQMQARNIRAAEIWSTGPSLVLAEDYPTFVHGPCCLLAGTTSGGRPLHLVSSYPSRVPVRLITVYEPNRSVWHDDFITRRNR